MFRSVEFKTYPNKYKATNAKAPDIKGTVEVVTTDGEVLTYDYAQWKPAPGKVQTFTRWKLKEPDDHRGDPNEEQPEPTSPPARAANTPPPPPRPVEEDTGRW